MKEGGMPAALLRLPSSSGAAAAGEQATGTECEQGEAAWLRHRRKFGLHTGNRGECRAGDARIVKDQASEFHRVARRTTIESVRFQPAVCSRSPVYSTIRKRNSIQVSPILRRSSSRARLTNPTPDYGGEGFISPHIHQPRKSKGPPPEPHTYHAPGD